MIIQVASPSGWNKHHTLYYRRWYQSKEATRAWRAHEAMIVPVELNRHNQLHFDVPPISPVVSDGLASYALRICHDIDVDSAAYTHYEAFNVVRDELESVARNRRRLRMREMGAEALRMVDFFDDQLDYISEDPSLRVD